MGITTLRLDIRGDSIYSVPVIVVMPGAGYCKTGFILRLIGLWGLLPVTVAALMRKI